MHFFRKKSHQEDDSEVKNLYTMKRGQRGIVTEIHGGHIFKRRLADIGIREEKTLTKVCNQPLHGPVQVKVDNTEIALGKHMAMRIKVRCIETLTCEGDG